MYAFNSKIALSLASIAATGALIVGATFAFFSDTESSTGNLLQAGKIDLKIDNKSYYNGAINTGTSWELANLDDGNGSGPNGSYLFFNFNDVKPADFGEDTISLHVDDNPCWICAEIKLTSNNDNGSTEPETKDEVPYTDGVGNGELAAKINFLWWADDGDNVLEVGENPLPVGGPIGDLGVGNTATITLADSQTSIWSPDPSPSPFPGGTETKYIGKAWCFGTITAAALASSSYSGPDNPANDGLNPSGPATSKDGGYLCDGSAEDNSTQTDSLTFDIAFKAYQARNNPNFKCTQASPSATPTATPSASPGTSPSPTPSPSATPNPCNDKPDVMMILDRSSSISSSELSQLKTAAKNFVDSLAPSTNTTHVGVASFSTTSALNQHLTENGSSAKTAIDSLIANGLTNLQSGIVTASTELANPGDGDDRPDLTSPDFMIIITDGNPNEPGSDSNARAVAATAATNAKADGAKIYVVGVGGDVDSTYLQNQIASPGSYFSIANYSDLSAILTSIANCPQ